MVLFKKLHLPGGTVGWRGFCWSRAQRRGWSEGDQIHIWTCLTSWLCRRWWAVWGLRGRRNMWWRSRSARCPARRSGMLTSCRWDLLITCFGRFEENCLRWFMPSSSCVSSTKELVGGPPWTSRQLDLPTQWWVERLGYNIASKEAVADERAQTYYSALSSSFVY